MDCTMGRNTGSVISMMPTGSSTMARKNTITIMVMMTAQGPPGMPVIMPSISSCAPMLW